MQKFTFEYLQAPTFYEYCYTFGSKGYRLTTGFAVTNTGFIFTL